MRKYKLTGCARFLIFLLIATPIAYFGASYYNNQNPFQSVKTWFVGSTEQKANPPAMIEGDSDTSVVSFPGDTLSGDEQAESRRNTSGQASDQDALLEILDQKEERIEQLIRENERLRNELERLKKQE